MCLVVWRNLKAFKMLLATYVFNVWVMQYTNSGSHNMNLFSDSLLLRTTVSMTYCHTQLTQMFSQHNWNHSWREKLWSTNQLTFPRFITSNLEPFSLTERDRERKQVRGIIRWESGRDRQMHTDEQQQQSSDWHSILVKSLSTVCPISCLSTVIRSFSV